VVGGVMTRVEEDVTQRIRHLARRLQLACVIAARHDAAAAAELRVEALRELGEQDLHAARERSAVVGLGDEVEVVRQHAVVDHAQTGELLAKGPEHAHDDPPRGALAQIRHVDAHAHGDEQRMAGVEFRSRRVRNGRPLGRSLAPGALASTTPRRHVQLELLRSHPTSRHRDTSDRSGRLSIAVRCVEENFESASESFSARARR